MMKAFQLVSIPAISGNVISCPTRRLCDWIRHALEEKLERRWEIKMNGVGVPDAYTSAAGWFSPRPR